MTEEFELDAFWEERPDIQKIAWMETKEMCFVETVEVLNKVIDECIESGLYALDLESTGRDVRVFNGQTVARIVGACISPDGEKAYYIPIRHNVKDFDGNLPWSAFEEAMSRLLASEAHAIFHNGKFDQELLQFNGGRPLGEWDRHKNWEDSLIMAYLENSREMRVALKALSLKYLRQEMIELKDLFGENHKGPLDFSTLDPRWDPVVWYGCSDALCTYGLYQFYKDKIRGRASDGSGLNTIYTIEKMTVPSTRWMERPRLLVDKEKVRALLEIGQKEYLEALDQIYQSATEILGRDIMPQYFKKLKNDFAPTEPINDQIELAKGLAALLPEKDPTTKIPKEVSVPKNEVLLFLRLRPDDRMAWLKKILGEDGGIAKKLKESVRAVIQTALYYWPKDDRNYEDAVAIGAKYKIPSDKEGRYEARFPPVYDIKSQQQLGMLFKEMGIPNLTRTASGMIATSKAVIDEIVADAEHQFPWMKRVKRFRETEKAISSYLVPLLEDSDPNDDTIKISYNAHRIETGRFCTPGDKKLDGGGTRMNMHGMPNQYDPKRPECMNRLRECFIARPDCYIVAIDYDGVELRIAANFSREPKWIKAYFECSDCKHQFDRGDGKSTPEPPPPFCPTCGSDKIGDLHTLTALAIFGDKARERDDWKQLRQNAKRVNFGLGYGGGPGAVQRSTGVSINEARRIKRKYDSSYPALKQWWRGQHQFVATHKFVRTAFDRKYPLPDIDDSRKGFVAAAQRNAINGPIQGSSADITKLAMALIYKVCKKRGWLDKVHMLVTLHDELVFEIHGSILFEAVEVFRHVMTRNKAVLKLKWPVPLTAGAEVGTSWACTWDFRKILAGKAPMPEVLKPLYEEYLTSRPEEELAEEKPTEEAKPAEVQKPDLPVVDMGRSKTYPESRSGTPFVYRLPKRLDMLVLTDLGELLQACHRSGVAPLQLETSNGQRLPWPDGEIKVNPAFWLGAVKTKGW